MIRGLVNIIIVTVYVIAVTAVRQVARLFGVDVLGDVRDRDLRPVGPWAGR